MLAVTTGSASTAGLQGNRTFCHFSNNLSIVFFKKQEELVGGEHLQGDPAPVQRHGPGMEAGRVQGGRGVALRGRRVV